MALLFCPMVMLGQTWTNPSLTSLSSPVSAIDITELRSYIDTARTGCSLPTYLWTDNPLTPGKYTVKKVHLEELREALDQAYVVMQSQNGSSLPVHLSFVDPVIKAGETPVKALHFTQLRNMASGVSCTVSPPVTCGGVSLPASPGALSASCSGGMGAGCYDSTTGKIKPSCYSSTWATSPPFSNWRWCSPPMYGCTAGAWVWDPGTCAKNGPIFDLCP